MLPDETRKLLIEASDLNNGRTGASPGVEMQNKTLTGSYQERTPFGGLRIAGEHMTKVRISGTASDLCAAPAVAQVPQFHHGRLFNGLCESRPAAAALVLIRGGKERLAGDDIHIDALFKLIPELACVKRAPCRSPA